MYSLLDMITYIWIFTETFNVVPMAYINMITENNITLT